MVLPLDALPSFISRVKPGAISGTKILTGYSIDIGHRMRAKQHTGRRSINGLREGYSTWMRCGTNHHLLWEFLEVLPDQSNSCSDSQHPDLTCRAPIYFPQTYSPVPTIGNSNKVTDPSLWLLTLSDTISLFHCWASTESFAVSQANTCHGSFNTHPSWNSNNLWRSQSGGSW